MRAAKAALLNPPRSRLGNNQYRRRPLSSNEARILVVQGEIRWHHVKIFPSLAYKDGFFNFYKNFYEEVMADEEG